jgi:hypothetical protein
MAIYKMTLNSTKAAIAMTSRHTNMNLENRYRGSFANGKNAAASKNTAKAEIVKS